MKRNDEYVSLETAKLLQKAGYDDYKTYYPVLKSMDLETDEFIEEWPFSQDEAQMKEHGYPAPTVYEAQKWLRIHKGVIIETCYHNVVDKFIVRYCDTSNLGDKHWHSFDDEMYDKYEYERALDNCIRGYLNVYLTIDKIKVVVRYNNDHGYCRDYVTLPEKVPSVGDKIYLLVSYGEVVSVEHKIEDNGYKYVLCYVNEI